MNRNTFYNYIEEKLHTLGFRITTHGKLNILNLHLHSENFYLHFLNLLYGYELTNLNQSTQNAPAIDLIDNQNKIIIQVSATSTIEKIQTSLQKINPNTYPSYTFKFVSISKDASKLKKATFNPPKGISFTPADDILDITSILSKILSEDIIKLEQIHAFIEKELGSSLDTGQLLSVEDFIIRYGKSQFSTPIDNELLFHENLLKSAIEALKTAKFLLISGAAGLGKTLFSVTLAKKMQDADSNLKVFCLFDKGADLINDITATFSEAGDYLIFIDDANRLNNRLDYILHYLHDNNKNKTFRIIATVRDYARDSLREKVEKYTQIDEQKITPLTEEQIKELSEELGIENEYYQERIQKISGGNPRLAVMASKLANENQIESLRNVAYLYKVYFGQNENVKQVIDNKELMITACAISFFRHIDKYNEQQMQLVENSFNIKTETFWQHVNVLYKREIVDLYKNEVVKISDQVLSTYLFYMAVFEKELAPFSLIVQNFHPDFEDRIIDSLNPVRDAFDHNEIAKDVRNQTKAIFNKYYKSNDYKKLIGFLNMFWFALPTKSLLFAKKCIEDMRSVHIDWKCESFKSFGYNLNDSSLISLLIKFRNFSEQEFKMSFELLLEYLVKDSPSLGFVLRALVEHYNSKYDDVNCPYDIQAHIIDTLIKRMENGENYLFSRLFIITANAFLKIEYKVSQSRGNTINITTVKPTFDTKLLSLRKTIFPHLAILVKNPEFEPFVLDGFQNYIDIIKKEGKKIAKPDLVALIKPYFITALDNKNVNHCLIMQKYCDQLESLNLKFPPDWRKEFSNKTTELDNLFLKYKNRHQNLIQYFSNVSEKSFIAFLERCKELDQVSSGDNRNVPFVATATSLQESFEALFEVAPNIYPQLVSKHLEYDHYFNIDPFTIMRHLFKILPSNDVLSLLSSKEYRWKNRWLSEYYAQLPEKDITKNESDALIQHISNIQSNELHPSLVYLNNYKHADADIYNKVVDVLVQKSKKDRRYAKPLRSLFSRQSTLFGQWFNEFSTNTDLVFDAYLAAFNFYSALNSSFNIDSSGKVLKILLNERFDFLYKFIDQVYKNTTSPNVNTYMPKLDFLWDRESYIKDIEAYAKYIHNKNKNLYILEKNIFCRLFSENNSDTKSEKIPPKEETFLNTCIKNNANDIEFMCFIFNVIKNLHKNSKREFFERFINTNHDFKDFKKLILETLRYIYLGSQIPILINKKAFLESLLPLFNSIALLEHKDYVEELIEYKSKEIKDQKKKDFLEST